MNIVLCTDENFSIPCLVCIVSILENNKNNVCNIFVLTDGLEDSTVGKFKHLSNLYKQKIDIIKINENYFDGLVVSSFYPRSIYYRYMIPNVLENEDRALYLDCDIIVKSSLSSFYNMDITDVPCAVVIDQSADDILIKNRIETSSTYWNSGVLLMNLNNWRQYGLTKKLVDFINENQDKCIYPDQDAMNILFDKNVAYADVKYNCQVDWFYDINKVRVSKKYWNSIKQAVNNPVIIHYCERIKPWHPLCNHPKKDDFMRYAYMHKFIGFANFYRRIKVEYLKTLCQSLFKRIVSFVGKCKKCF